MDFNHAMRKGYETLFLGAPIASSGRFVHFLAVEMRIIRDQNIYPDSRRVRKSNRLVIIGSWNCRRPAPDSRVRMLVLANATSVMVYGGVVKLGI